MEKTRTTEVLTPQPTHRSCPAAARAPLAPLPDARGVQRALPGHHERAVAFSRLSRARQLIQVDVRLYCSNSGPAIGGCLVDHRVRGPEQHERTKQQRPRPRTPIGFGHDVIPVHLLQGEQRGKIDQCFHDDLYHQRAKQLDGIRVGIALSRVVEDQNQDNAVDGEHMLAQSLKRKRVHADVLAPVAGELGRRVLDEPPEQPAVHKLVAQLHVDSEQVLSNTIDNQNCCHVLPPLYPDHYHPSDGGLEHNEKRWYEK
mmetsp:Transcript_131807/g.357941  ORF Transcript_131807/g.357941 Transcript_131807/m.357941 type:complete len:257 (+) Transcript_131807:493-1263(+)